MEDPWATGSSWATPAKPSLPLSPSSTPPPTFDVADPWGAPTPGPSRLQHEPAPVQHDEQDEQDVPQALGGLAPTDEPSTGGWASAGGGGWDGVEPPSNPQPELIASPPGAELTTVKEDVGWGSGSPDQGITSLPITNVITSDPDPELAATFPLPTSPQTSTPPPSLFALPSLETDTHPAGPSSLSPNSHPPYTAPSPVIDKDDLPATMPKSPSFGDDFGGFSNGFGGGGDPWGGGAASVAITTDKDLAWDSGEISRKDSAPFADEVDVVNDEEDEDSGGWGGAERVVGQQSVQKAGMDEDWELAQRRMRLAEERAPRERIEGLKTEWKGLVEGVIGLNKLEGLSEQDEQASEAAIRKLTDEITETLRSLSTLPPDINTYHTDLNALVTHERHAYALARPNPAPETSLLNLPTIRRSRRDDHASSSLDSWTSRSRLGEPDIPVETTPAVEEARPRWSFWRKNTSEKQLVTSGGGILEVKQAATRTEPRPSSSSGTAAVEPARPDSRAGSILSTKPSRPASPAIPISASTPTRTPTPLPTLVSDDFGHTSPSGPLNTTQPEAQAPPPSQSAVTRFFGRLGRRQPSQTTVNVDDKDLELSADDFSFLDQVPSLSTGVPDKGVGDLLSLEPGRGEGIASLESMLNSKPVPLPAPLAPPPAPSRSASSSGRFVPQMKASQPSNMDLLSGLDFGDDSPSSVPPSQTTSTPAPSNSAWDDFLSPPSKSSPISMVSPPPPPPAKPAFTSTIPAPQPSHPSSSLTPLSSLSTPSRVPHITPAPNPALVAPPTPGHDGFGDFSTFGESSTITSSFDDFGDFGDFATSQDGASGSTPQISTTTTTLQPSPTFGSTPLPSVEPVTPIRRTGHPSLDHTPTINLLSGASATKGRQWPAPPSPGLPSLEPPPPKSAVTPTVGSSAGAFPFLSPPPAGPSRPASRSSLAAAADDSDLLSQGMESTFIGSAPMSAANSAGLVPSPLRTQSPQMPIARPSPQAQVPSQPQALSSTSGMTLSPLSMPVQQPSTSRSVSPAPPLQPSAAGVQPGKSGLSAQDLSFFDSL